LAPRRISIVLALEVETARRETESAAGAGKRANRHLLHPGREHRVGGKRGIAQASRRNVYRQPLSRFFAAPGTLHQPLDSTSLLIRSGHNDLVRAFDALLDAINRMVKRVSDRQSRRGVERAVAAPFSTPTMHFR
jgi:hypothetical protein